MKNTLTKILVGIFLLLTFPMAIAGPFTISTETLESVRIETFYNEDSDKGQLNASPTSCSSCPTKSLQFDKSVLASIKDKPVSFKEFLNWKSVVVDVDYDKTTEAVVAIRRH